MQEIKKILIIQTASIGDVILTTSMIEKLYAYYPHAQIDFILKKGNESLFKYHPYLSNIFIWNKINGKYRNLFDLIKKVRKQKYDLLFVVQRFLSSGLLTTFSGAKIKVGFHKNPMSLFFNHRITHKIARKGEDGIHEIERNHKLIERWTNHIPANVKLYPSNHDWTKTLVYKTKKYICIAPTSLWYTKQYPLIKWIDFVKNIDSTVYVYFLGSQNDIDFCQQIINKSGHPNCLNLSGKLKFLESAALMKDAIMNFVNDSAPLHLASSVNAPVTVIYCSTIPEFGYGPLSDNANIIEVEEKLDCRPCGLHGYKKCPKGHFKCAMDIDTKLLVTLIK